MADFGELVAQLFLSREVAHRAHLKEKGQGSYARHIALNDFYDAIVEHADSIAEAYQGEYAKLLDIPMLEDDENAIDDIAATLRRHKAWVDQHRYDEVPKEQTSIQNIIDGAVLEYQRVLYKLTFLE